MKAIANDMTIEPTMTHHTAESRRHATDVVTGGHRLTSVVPDPDAAGSPSVDEVLRDLVDHGCRRLTDRVAAAGIIRRRSVTEVLIEGMDVLWDDVLAHRDEYRAVLMLQRTRPELRVPGPDGDVADRGASVGCRVRRRRCHDCHRSREEPQLLPA